MDYLDEIAGAASARTDVHEEPSLEIDAARRLADWSQGAERVLGWTRGQVIGEPILATLIAARHRELFERMLDACFEGKTATAPDPPVEVQAVGPDGREVTVEIRLNRVDGRVGGLAVVAVFRDVSERRELERLLHLNDAVDDAITAGRSPQHLLQQVLEQVCSIFGWAAGAYWRVDPRTSRLLVEAFWRAGALSGSDLEQLGPGARCARGEGIAGVAWAHDRTTWSADLGARVGTRLEAAALDAGLNSVIAAPVRAGRETLGVLEFFSASGQPGRARLAHLESIGLRLGRYLQDSPPADRTRKRYKVDTRNSHLAFSCAFMKFLTVHGRFREFGGWAEVDDDDPRTARAECTIQTATVDTRSLERDFHLRSADFFAVERFPSMAFRSTTVEALGDEHFRVFGDLTIRDVTRPIQLDVRLEDRDVDQAGVERMTLSAGTVINRLDWFLDWERALQAGRWIVGNQVRLDLVITLVHRPDASVERR